jgi:hypothetical protein
MQPGEHLNRILPGHPGIHWLNRGRLERHDFADRGIRQTIGVGSSLPLEVAGQKVGQRRLARVLNTLNRPVHGLSFSQRALG